eukprot:2177161-Rhodomonas_salina.1
MSGRSHLKKLLCFKRIGEGIQFFALCESKDRMQYVYTFELDRNEKPPPDSKIQNFILLLVDKFKPSPGEAQAHEYTHKRSQVMGT